MNLYTRRKLLRLLAASGTTAWAASHLGFLTNDGRAASPLMSQGGALDFSLAAQTGRLSLAGRRARLYGYNGSVPGPRLEIRPGDLVRIRFANRLPEPTNLHFHGLHVSPRGNADNVFLEIPPGESQIYEFSLPQDNRGGTFWYHPHIHHLIARQLWAGLAGLLIVQLARFLQERHFDFLSVSAASPEDTRKNCAEFNLMTLWHRRYLRGKVECGFEARHEAD